MVHYRCYDKAVRFLTGLNSEGLAIVPASRCKCGGSLISKWFAHRLRTQAGSPTSKKSPVNYDENTQCGDFSCRFAQDSFKRSGILGHLTVSFSIALYWLPITRRMLPKAPLPTSRLLVTDSARIPSDYFRVAALHSEPRSKVLPKCGRRQSTQIDGRWVNVLEHLVASRRLLQR